MNFRYDFGEKLDLSKFQKQATHYAKNQSEYILVMSHFMIWVKFFQVQRVSIATYDIIKDPDGNIIQKQAIYLGSDDRFQGFKDVQFFTRNCPPGFEFEVRFAEYDKIIEQICGLIKIFHKINGLKAFL